MSKELEKEFMNDITSKVELTVEPEDIAMLLYDIYEVPSGICEQIKNMVKRLEAIDNSNPSEAMKSVNFLGALLPEWLRTNDGKDVLDTIKQTLIKAEQDRKELEYYRIIKRAVKDGIYIENIDGDMINFKCELYYKNEELGWYFLIYNGYVPLTDYKIKFWLKADRSE